MKQTLDQILKENETNKELVKFIKDNKITDEQLKANNQLFQEYLDSYTLCKTKENITKCQQKIPGYRLKLIINNNQKITTVLTDCLHRINKSNQKEAFNNFLIRHYDDSLLSLSLTKDFKSKGRTEVINYLKEILQQKDYPKGLYLHGEPGVGKTFIFILLANKIIQKKQTVCFISWPQFVSDIKKNFKNDNDNNNQIDQVKNCDVLFIDDLGSEAVSSWERDELLFPILNARVLPLKIKTTFINSSYNINELSLCYTLQNNKIEEMKIKRLIERIKKLTKEIKLTN